MVTEMSDKTSKMSVPLLLFAKAPIAGKVKTRLQSHCTPEKAAEIAEILLEESIVRATSFWPGDVYLSVALDAQHPFLQRMVAQYQVTLVSQCDGDLGAKMHGAFEEFAYPCAIMGCDAPHILGSDLVKAHDHLIQGKNVLGPSDDGGYYFIGLGHSAEMLFNSMEWGTETVLANTLERAKKNNVEFEFLTPLNDVDEWQDLLSVAKILPSLAAVIDD